MSSLRSNRALVIAAVMASMAMIAIEATIVATAMPQIAAELGNLNLYSWVFSSFLLAQTTMTVVFGKLADIYGRKPILMAGIAVFLVGSLLAGFAHSMPEMIAYRLLQGIGAGSIQPVAMTVVADLYPGRERGKIQGDHPLIKQYAGYFPLYNVKCEPFHDRRFTHTGFPYKNRVVLFATGQYLRYTFYLVLPAYNRIKRSVFGKPGNIPAEIIKHRGF